MISNNDEDLFVRKITDKANQALHNNYPTFTNFLDLHEQTIFKSHLKFLPNINYQMEGGHEACERKIIGFYPDDYIDSQIDFPISILQIIPQNLSEKLSHRDYLGALMHIGIERNKIGDIMRNQNGAYLICIDSISDYIIEQLITVKNTNIDIRKVEASEIVHIQPDFEAIKGTVASLRLDSVIKLGFSLSRGNADALIQAGKASINSKLNEKSSARIQEGDVISIRGFGKMKIHSVGDMTKKGRIFIEIYKYK